MTTAVTEDQAWEWEVDDLEELQLFSYRDDPEFGEYALNYFVEQRMKPWSTRVHDYHCHETSEPLLPGGNPRRSRLRDWIVEHSKNAIYNPQLEHSEVEQRLERLRKQRRGTEFHGFMSLPREIRDIVYRELVVKGTIFPPPRGEDGKTLQCFDKYLANAWGEVSERYAIFKDDVANRSDWPAISFQALFCVSKQFHSEVNHVFFRENRFVFPAGDWKWPLYLNHTFVLPPLRGFRKEIWDQTHSITDASYTFDMRDTPLSDAENLYQLRFLGRVDNRQQPLPQQNVLELLHDNKWRILRSRWFIRILSIQNMDMRRLQMAFDESYCAVGCCRMVEWLCDTLTNLPGDIPWLSEGKWGGPKGVRAPRVIDIFGWRDDEEKTMIEEKLAPLRDLGTRDINFLGRSLSKQQEDASIRTGWP
ncbi:hypothetical protein G7054_g4379 [Neopestalotiopsis clavispora]|nr:hypothetical protein G7054_g4379 [Neopestalotiopsis clavispora]